MVKTIYVTRHGHRANWLTDIPEPAPPTGIDGDSVLAQHGLDQAEELSKFLVKENPKIERIYSSPFYRCLQTATPTAEKLGLEIYAENGVGECYYRTRPTKPIPASAKELKKYFPKLNENYEPLLRVSPEGETIEELHERCIEALSRLVANLKQSPIDTILIVTHAATRIGIGRALVGDKNLDVRTSTCSLDKFVLPEGKSGKPGDWELEYTGKADYLTNGDEMHWTFYIGYEAGSKEDVLARKVAAATPGAIDINNKDKPISTTNKTTAHPPIQQIEQPTPTHIQTDDQVDIYIPLDLSLAHVAPGNIKESSIDPQSSFQMSELHNDNPLFRFGDVLYRGQWQDIVGTELITTPEGDYVASTRTRIQVKPVDAKNRDESSDERRTPLLEKIRQITHQRRSA